MVLVMANVSVYSTGSVSGMAVFVPVTTAIIIHEYSSLSILSESALTRMDG
jgi:hypothetical protein